MKKRTKNRKTGDRGEARVALRLFFRGYRILERNYTFYHKEIDIIAKRKNVLAFVEVKTRSDTSVPPQLAVTAKKQYNIRKAAEAYCRAHHTEGLTIRFDIAEVKVGGGINYIKNAF